MTENNLFAGGNDPTPDVLDQNKDYLSELVGNEKKFKDTKELAKGKYESDRYIETLTRTLDEMREDNKKLREAQVDGNKYDELVNLIKQGKSDESISPSPQEDKPELKLEDVEKLVAERMDRRDRLKKEQENFNLVQQRLKEQLGTNYSHILEEQREQMDLTVEEVNQLARRSPTMFYRTFGLENKQQTDPDLFSPPRSVQRNDNFAPKTTKRTWTYYQQLKRDNPTLYWDPKTVTQRHKDYETLKGDFEDGDFNSKLYS